MRLTRILLRAKETEADPNLGIATTDDWTVWSTSPSKPTPGTHIESVYRQSTESLARHRLQIVEKEEDVSKIEAEINAGQVEELINHAESELALIPKMEQWKVWEPLETPAEPGQWKYFT
ncbi:hypothetical protein SeLEV6574_g08267 [Synchytrium endobioticum]|uniref:NADH dehydrogenase [ubiquinone] 1 alpha subcomplex subunit 5 n=1 Tax=Synchytrium endobioticum TaxID=286115 RepID=A0A507C4M1_9FUNG|nr:hypothetical protein SeLEV6574_g08267 [Synchytrium endobioticum]